MKPIKAKELLQKLEEQCLDQRYVDLDTDLSFINGAFVMIELFQEQGLITKRQGYLQ